MSRINTLRSIIAGAVAAASLCSLASCNKVKLDESARSASVDIQSIEAASAVIQDVEETTAETTEPPTEPEPPDDLSELEDIINEKLTEFEGEWEVYVKNLDTDMYISINSHEMYAASLCKLYAMGAVYNYVDEGNCTEEEVSGYLENMITDSSNDAYNALMWKISLDYTTEWCRTNGYSDTSVEHGLWPASNASGLYTNVYSGWIYTSAADCGNILESIYRGECVNEEYSKKMMELLKGQLHTEKIPAGVPEGVVTANKTGETDEECHDAAIVFSDGADYILVAMSHTDAQNAWGYVTYITELSEIVYDYFND